MFSSTVYNVFYYFILYSFFGWVFESTYVSIRHKKLVNRGFLNGPFCPIYAAGALSVFYLLSQIKFNIVYIYFGGCIIATVLEYIIGFAMEKLFHAKWWDYSSKRFNIGGRVCLTSTIAWGFLSVSMMYIIQPNVEKIVESMPINTGLILAALLIVYLMVDTTLTVYNVIRLNGKLESIKGSVLEIKQSLTNLVESDITDELKAKLTNSLNNLSAKLPSLNNIRESEFAEDIKAYLEQKKEPTDLKVYLEDKYKKLYEALEKYRNVSFKKNAIQDRILKAYPHIKSIEFDEYLNQLKSIIKNRKPK
jgi:uncharacterized membrane protein